MIVVLPAPTIVTSPFTSTVATFLFEDSYVTLPSPTTFNSFVNGSFPYVLPIDVTA